MGPRVDWSGRSDRVSWGLEGCAPCLLPELVLSLSSLASETSFPWSWRVRPLTEPPSRYACGNLVRNRSRRSVALRWPRFSRVSCWIRVHWNPCTAYPLSRASSSATVNGRRERRRDFMAKCGSGIPRDSKVDLDLLVSVGVALAVEFGLELVVFGAISLVFEELLPLLLEDGSFKPTVTLLPTERDSALAGRGGGK